MSKMMNKVVQFVPPLVQQQQLDWNRPWAIWVRVRQTDRQTEETQTRRSNEAPAAVKEEEAPENYLVLMACRAHTQQIKIRQIIQYFNVY